MNESADNPGVSVSPSPDGGEQPAGVVDRLRFPAMEGAETREQLERLLEAARRTDYRSAIHEVMGEKTAGYTLNDDRLLILDLAELDAEKDVLEIGASLGQMTVHIAKRVKTLNALEAVKPQANFAAERCRQEGIDNAVITAGGDDCTLPYPDNAFDTVVMNLVFEWCGRWDESIPHENGQRQMLAEIARVLRPNGQFVINTKNRFAMRLLLGGGDEHAYQMRFGHALPNWLMYLILKMKGKSLPTRGKLHSYRKFNRMIREAGFEQLETYWLIPTMRYPTHIFSTDSAAIRKARRESKLVQGPQKRVHMVVRWLPAWCVKHVASGLCTVARRKP